MADLNATDIEPQKKNDFVVHISLLRGKFPKDSKNEVCLTHFLHGVHIAAFLVFKDYFIFTV